MNRQAWIDDAIHVYRNHKDQCERAAAQVSDGDFFLTLGRYPLSIAALMKHLGGSLHSRWRDFLTTDGEKRDRDRESEFIAQGETRESIMLIWEKGWQTTVDSLTGLTPDDLDRSVTIRGQSLSVPAAINRNLTHLAGHTGQIILLARHFAGERWQTLSIAPGKSEEYNAAMRDKYGDWYAKE